jgi:hypothetical protein
MATNVDALAIAGTLTLAHQSVLKTGLLLDIDRQTLKSDARSILLGNKADGDQSASVGTLSKIAETKMMENQLLHLTGAATQEAGEFPSFDLPSPLTLLYLIYIYSTFRHN